MGVQPSTVGSAIYATGSSQPPVTHDPSAQAHLEMQKQQRLIQLLHAANCTVQTGCLKTNCELFKTSLPHFLICQTSNCVQRHCDSSRFCLLHWAGCTDLRCEVCPAVNKEYSTSPRALAIRQELIAQQKSVNGGQYAGIKRVSTGADNSVTDYKRPRTDVAMPSLASIVASIQNGTTPGMSREQWSLLSVEDQQAWLLQEQRRLALTSASVLRQPPAQQTAPRATAKTRIDGNCTLIATMDKIGILDHLTSLREDFNTIVTPEQIKLEMGDILNRIMQQVRL